MILKELLQNVKTISVLGDTQVKVASLVQDSRKVSLNDVFVAIEGEQFDGHQFIPQAIAGGAKVVVCRLLPQVVEKEIVYVQVQNTSRAFALMAANFYGNPSEKLKLVGITGTNGKTTTTTLLYQLFKLLGYKVGLVSTIAIYVDNQRYETKNTTPDALTLNKYFDEMVQQGVTHCFMEVSSHAVVQHRIDGIVFAGGVFTNLTHDHLDYHQTFAAYRDAKKGFFDKLPKHSFALVNADDKNASVMHQNTRAKRVSYALKTLTDYHLHILENQISGLVVRINGQELYTNLIGEFNAYNLLSVFAVADLLGEDELQVLVKMSLLHAVAGRFQYVVSDENITAIVDYAHTPDALKNVLETIRSVSFKGKVITIVGCGGNRDRSKRPLMAQIAVQMSDVVILTSDNPRDENPLEILKEMEAGIPSNQYKKYSVIADREHAIKTACQIATQGDVILVAGKGHETYQEVKGVRTHFDDMEQVRKMLGV